MHKIKISMFLLPKFYSKQKKAYKSAMFTKKVRMK